MSEEDVEILVDDEDVPLPDEDKHAERFFELRGRLVSLRIPYPEEGDHLMAIIDLNDIMGRRGRMILPYDADFLQALGTPYLFQIKIFRTGMDEYMGQLPRSLKRIPDTRMEGVV